MHVGDVPELSSLAGAVLPYIIPYSGKLMREKAFTNFTVLEPSVKLFSTKFGRAVPTYDRFLVKIFSAKWSLIPICESFLPRKFPAIR